MTTKDKIEILATFTMPASIDRAIRRAMRRNKIRYSIWLASMYKQKYLHLQTIS